MEILLIEDNPAEARLTREAFNELFVDDWERASAGNRVNVVSDGVEALRYLRREEGYRDAARPDMILLDLNLPRKDGREVLQEVKQDESLSRIPLVVLSGSDAEEDVARSYDLHANCYVTKPADLDQFLRVVRTIHEFWLNTVQLPPAEEKCQRRALR